MRTAVIGIGSNSLRMLVGDIADGQLHRVKRYREGLRTFAALDDRGNISMEMIHKACGHVEDFRRQAVESGAEKVHLFATSAVRDAANQQQFISALEEATSLELEVCSGELEAQMSYIGATDGGAAGLIDIGGGSTEIVVGRGGRIGHAVSQQMGAVRLFRRLPITDSASAKRVVDMAAEILAPALPGFMGEQYPLWVGVGGTFTTTAALVQRIPWDNRKKIHGYLLGRDEVEQAMEYLAPMPLEERLKLGSLQPQRADIVVHGLAILLACMQGLNISQIQVSEYGNLEGYLKMKYLSAGNR